MLPTSAFKFNLRGYNKGADPAEVLAAALAK
jgi:hypothetical protein